MHHKKSSSIQSSAAVVGGNNDLLTEILLFLPAKSLLRFKLVSKQWRSLISAESFSLLHSLHRRRGHEPHHSFILGATTSQFFICNPTIKKLVPFRFPFPYVKILQSCNGLLLLECGNFPRGRKDYYVFNPTTMQYRDLRLWGGAAAGVCLMYDPSKSHHYRVVCFKNYENFIRFRLYDSSTHKWRVVSDSLHGPYKFWDGVFWDDRVYFIRNRSISFCFSPENKICSIPDLTKRSYSRGMKKYVMASNGHLHYLWLSNSTADKKMDLEVFEMINDKWLLISKRAGSKRRSATIFVGDGATEIDLLGMMRGETTNESMLLVHVPGKIMIYRFFDEVCEVVIDFRSHYFYQEGRLQFGFKDAHPLIESLAPV